MKEGKYTGKNGKLMEPGDETKHEMMKKDVKLDGIEGVESGKQPGNKSNSNNNSNNNNLLC